MAVDQYGVADLARRVVLETIRVAAMVVLVTLGWTVLVVLTVLVARIWPGAPTPSLR